MVGRFLEYVFPTSRKFEHRRLSISHSYGLPQEIKASKRTDFVFQDIKNFIEVCCEAHNLYRSLHGCPPLKLSNRLNAYADEWAHVSIEYTTFIHSFLH